MIKKLFKEKKMIIAVSAAAAVLIAAVIIVFCISSAVKVEGTAYVTPVSEVNTAAVNISGNKFSGVVESQKTIEIKLESDKTIKEILVSEGDSVKEGDVLFSYDIESMQLDLEAGQIEVERMQNEIDTTEKQIKELEEEKKNASSDNQVSYTTQIQALRTDIDKTKYDIKVKNNSLDKLKTSIKNAAVKASVSGTVKGLKTPEQMLENGTDVIMTIMTDGDFRIKGRINEQNIGAIVEGDFVIIRSRVDDETTWKGVVDEISTEPETNNNSYMYGDGDTESMSSNYSFYIKPDSITGLMLGQHVLIEPDLGSNTEIEKTGIWLFDDYVIDIDGDEPYVWSVDSFGRLEKRTVKIGQRDESNGDSEILSGLESTDLIAYPADDYKEGMKTSNKEDEELDMEINGAGEDMDFDPGAAGDDMYDDGMFDDDMYDDSMLDDGMTDDSQADSKDESSDDSSDSGSESSDGESDDSKGE